MNQFYKKVRQINLKKLLWEDEKEKKSIRKRLNSNLHYVYFNMSNYLFLIINLLFLITIRLFIGRGFIYYTDMFIICLECLNLVSLTIKLYNYRYFWMSVHFITGIFKLLIVVYMFFNHFRRIDIVRQFFLPSDRTLKINEVGIIAYFLYFRTIYYTQIIACIVVYSGRVVKRIFFFNKIGTMLIGTGFFIFIISIRFSSEFNLFQTFIGQVHVLSFMIFCLIFCLKVSSRWIIGFLNDFIYLCNSIFLFTLTYLILSFNINSYEILLSEEIGDVLAQEASADFLKMTYNFVKLKLIQLFDVSDKNLIKIQ